MPDAISDVIYADDFHQASDEHKEKSPNCRTFRYGGNKMICAHCGQVWLKPSAIRDMFREGGVPSAAEVIRRVRAELCEPSSH